MAIADKLQTIAENQQSVYDAGYRAGAGASGNQGYDSGYTDGYNDGSALKDKKPYIDTREITDFRYFNQEGKRTAILPKLDTSNGTNFFYFCYGATNVVTVDLNVSKAIQCSNAFNGCTALKTVVYLDFSSIPHTTSTSNGVSGIFTKCAALVDITIKPNCLKAPISFANSPLLSDESIDSIINSLVQWDDTTKKKLTLNSSVVEKLTDEQLTTIFNKGWEVA